MCAAKLATLKRGEVGKGRGIDLQICRSIFTVEQAAAKFGVGLRSVGSAKLILENGCAELIEAVSQGGISLNKAQVIIGKLPSKSDQAALLKQGKAAINELTRKRWAGRLRNLGYDVG